MKVCSYCYRVYEDDREYCPDCGNGESSKLYGEPPFYDDIVVYKEGADGKEMDSESH